MISKDLFSTLVYFWIAFGIVVFLVLLKVAAPYGRHSKTGWGPMIDNNLGWFLMELPSLILPAYIVLRYGRVCNLLVIFAVVLWTAHYFHRVVIYPLRIHTKGKMMPVIIVVCAWFFNLANGSINGYWLAYFAPEFSPVSAEGIRLFAGLAVFVAGFALNQYHDRILIGLRKPGSGEYSIPYGGLFRYVSCPNFFGEIIEWAGFAIMVWSLPGLAFFVWTFVNLVPRALEHHKWYKSNFKDYPAERKAVIPFVL
jgi:3-oxo-5-alpha-steroid 4-dehydrogenase 1